MTEERMKDMIHETLESGGSITQAKGHDQELIVTLMSSKCSLGNVFLFHMYLVVARMEIKFSKVLSTTQFIQQVINDRNGKFVFDGEFVEGVKVMDTCTKFLEQFSQFHSSGKRDDDKGEHWEEGCPGLEEWNDHEHHGKGEFHGEW
jgi:hypothetical protein